MIEALLTWLLAAVQARRVRREQAAERARLLADPYYCATCDDVIPWRDMHYSTCPRHGEEE